MHRGVASKPLELTRKSNQIGNSVVAAGLFEDARLFFQRLFQRDAEIIWDQLGNFIDAAVAELQHATDIPDDGLGVHLTKGRDLGYRIGAVLLGDVLDHFVAAVLTEVDVKVRHRDAVWIEKAFEEQIVRNWV